MRAFLGLDVPESARRALSSIRARFDDGVTGRLALRWTRPENLHLTVRFLGEVENSICDGLTAKLRGSLRSFGPINVEVTSVSWFPSRRPVVLAASVSASERLETLFTIVERDVVSMGLPAESRPAHPHVTIARLRRRSGGRIPSFEEYVGVEFSCQELILFRSELHAGGARYNRHNEISLGSQASTS